MPLRCVVFGFSKTPDTGKGLSHHKISFEGDLRPEEKKRRKKWIQFVADCPCQRFELVTNLAQKRDMCSR